MFSDVPQRLNPSPGLPSCTGIKWQLYEPNVKKIIIIAGPNGAGKTTFARDFCRPKHKHSGSSMQT